MLSGLYLASFTRKKRLIKYRSGTIYNQKHAVRLKQSNSLSCPIYSCQDSALHILSGCQHPIIRNMVTERHNIASRLITKATSKGSLGSCLVSTDVGSADKHRMQISSNTSDIRIQSSSGLDFCYKPQSKRQTHFRRALTPF